MRLCRFVNVSMAQELELAGYYREEGVVPATLAWEMCAERENPDLPPLVSENLLDLLPPRGALWREARDVAAWLEREWEEVGEKLIVPWEEVELLAPIPAPGKILLLAGNYAKHIQERGGVAAEREQTFPYVFMKPLTTLNVPFGAVVLPKISPDRIDWECELGVVIGRRCRHVSEEQALEYVAGYTVINDISDRGFQPNPGRKPRERDKFFDWMHGKWHDTFLPVGPCVLSSDAVDDPQTFRLRLEVNGEVKQNADTGQMVFPVAAVIAFLSEMVTLEPGDLIATGTPAGVGHASNVFLRSGDTVVARIEGIGDLENPVVSELEWESENEPEPESD